MVTMIKKTGVSPSTESILLEKLMDANKQLATSSEKVIISINEEKSLSMVMTKEKSVEFIREITEQAFLFQLTFDQSDGNWNYNLSFKVADFQIKRRDAIKDLYELGLEVSVYLEDYKHLIVTCDYGGFLGEVSEVEPDQVGRADALARKFSNEYCIVSGSYKALIDEYCKQGEA